MKEKDNENVQQLSGDQQTLLNLIRKEARRSDSNTKKLIDDLKDEIKDEISDAVGCKITVLQKGVSNLQSVKTDMKQVKKDIREMKDSIKQLQDDVDTVTSDYGYERDENGKLKPDKS